MKDILCADARYGTKHILSTTARYRWDTSEKHRYDLREVDDGCLELRLGSGAVLVTCVGLDTRSLDSAGLLDGRELPFVDEDLGACNVFTRFLVRLSHLK